MGRRPARCYRYIKNKPYCKGKYCRSGPDTRIRQHECGNKKAAPDMFPKTLMLISMEKENVTSNALEACRTCANRYLVKYCQGGRTGFALRLQSFGIFLNRINKTLSCAGADRLQSGMRGAYGRPHERIDRVYPGKIIMSVRVKEGDVDIAKEAFRRARMKIAGRQKIVVSKNYGFSNYTEEEIMAAKAEGTLENCGTHFKIRKPKGPIPKN
ncbi:hypothetical protein PCE1_000270 [Barthelona sp. PCE]